MFRGAVSREISARGRQRSRTCRFRWHSQTGIAPSEAPSIRPYRIRDEFINTLLAFPDLLPDVVEHAAGQKHLGLTRGEPGRGGEGKVAGEILHGYRLSGLYGCT